MKLGKIEISYEEVSLNDLTPEVKTLHDATLHALELAYAPYSNFKVGAGLLMEDGSIVIGNNQENAAYPSGLCAERVAFFKLRSEHQTPIQTVMVLAQNRDGDRPGAFPCGSCRQVMLEYATMQESPIQLFMQLDATHFYRLDDVRALLPFSFTNNVL